MKEYKYFGIVPTGRHGKFRIMYIDLNDPTMFPGCTIQEVIYDGRVLFRALLKNKTIAPLHDIDKFILNIEENKHSSAAYTEQYYAAHRVVIYASDILRCLKPIFAPDLFIHDKNTKNENEKLNTLFEFLVVNPNKHVAKINLAYEHIWNLEIISKMLTQDTSILLQPTIETVSKREYFAEMENIDTSTGFIDRAWSSMQYYEKNTLLYDEQEQNNASKNDSANSYKRRKLVL